MSLEFSPGAEAGLRQIATGNSGCRLLKLTNHEVVDLVLSGRAFGTLENSDGTLELIEIVDETHELQKLADLWRAAGTLRII
jgi:hypothetical protein